MADKITLDLETRTVVGKKVNRLRRAGVLPATVYGKGVGPFTVQISARGFNEAYRRAGKTSLVDLTIRSGLTFVLIWVGGLVTSHGVGMSVPDWPTTYGYNMFFFPFSKWVGGIFYEHSHRLVASAVGFCTLILAAWLAWREERRWVRRLGWLALGAVILQGVLGGLRVTAMKDFLGVFHATLAQMFFALTCVLALVTSRWWRQGDFQSWAGPGLARLRGPMALVTGLMLGQLMLGAFTAFEDIDFVRQFIDTGLFLFDKKVVFTNLFGEICNRFFEFGGLVGKVITNRSDFLFGFRFRKTKNHAFVP